MMRRPWRGSSRAEPPESPPILFVHVMKTAGTTLMRNLRETYEIEEIYPYRPLDIRYDEGRVEIERHLSVPYLLALPEERHDRIKVYTGHFPYLVRELLPRPVVAVTVLRHPVDRTISLLRQFRRKASWLGEVAPRSPVTGLTLEEVYEHPLVYAPLVHNHMTKIFSMSIEDDPQTYMDVIDVDAARLARAKENLSDVEVVGLIECYDEFLDEVEARFGWKIVRGARKNATPESDIQPVDAGLRRRIAEDNALDVELYEHACELVELRRTAGAAPGPR
jgi:hypothetical protein